MNKKDILKAIKDYQRKVASGGGKARAKKLTPEERKQIARKAARTRWGVPKPKPRRRKRR